MRWLALWPLLGALGSAEAAAINVLWYTYADPLSEYRGADSGIQSIANLAPGYPQGSGLAWNLTFFDNHSPTPDFSAYDVLVTESGEAFRTNAPGGALATPNYDAILDNRAAISAARGDRTFISGTDADFHAIRGDSGNCAAFSGCGLWDGARGYLVNMVNWAASGNGLGIVALLDGEFPAVADRWWAQPNSFLHDELAGHVQYFRDNAPVLSSAAEGYPLNAGLTSTGLGDWRNSFHAGFVDVAGYTGTVFSSARPRRGDEYRHHRLRRCGPDAGTATYRCGDGRPHRRRYARPHHAAGRQRSAHQPRPVRHTRAGFGAERGALAGDVGRTGRRAVGAGAAPTGA
jgi:hypothetical protein